MTAQPSTTDFESGTFCFKEGAAFIAESITTYDLCTEICTNSRFNFTGSAVTFIQTSQLERFGGDVRRLCTLYVAN